MKAVVQRVRQHLLAADPRLGECIKWQAPTFTFKGNLASFFPRSKQHASLMVHQGAQLPGVHPRLEGGGGTGRMMKFASVAQADAARPDLEALVKAWCDWRTGGVKAPAAKKSSAAKRSSARRR